MGRVKGRRTGKRSGLWRPKLCVVKAVDRDQRRWTFIRNDGSFGIFLLITDGDTSILKALKGAEILFQRCLWHLPYQMEYYLWKDDVKRKSEQRYHISGEVFDITAIWQGVDEREEIKAIIAAKTRRLEGKSVSNAERVMRTVNLRTTVGVHQGR